MDKGKKERKIIIHKICLISVHTWKPDSWKFMMASDILMLIGSTVISTLKGPTKRSDKLVSDSANSKVS